MVLGIRLDGVVGPCPCRGYVPGVFRIIRATNANALSVETSLISGSFVAAAMVAAPIVCDSPERGGALLPTLVRMSVAALVLLLALWCFGL